MESQQTVRKPRVPWNKGKLVGQKAPFKPKDVWAMRARMQQEHRTRDLVLLNLGIDSKLRGCDLVALKVSARDHYAAQDGATGAVRDHAGNTRVCGDLDPRGAFDLG